MDEVGFEYLDDENDDVGIQTSMEFKPVDHPLEPPNEDCSAKWPFPTSALDGMVHAGNVTKCNVPLEGDNFKKEGDVTNEGVHLAKAVNKRRRGVRDDTEAQQVKGPVISIFQVFQQCKEL